MKKLLLLVLFLLVMLIQQAFAISVEKTATGAFKVTVGDKSEIYTSLSYTVNTNNTVSIFSSIEIPETVRGKRLLPALGIAISEWTIDGETGFTTAEQVGNALGNLGVSGIGINTQVFLNNGNTPGTLVTRPANTTPYTAGDCVTDTSGVISYIDSIVSEVGTTADIMRVRLFTNDGGFNGKKFTVIFYNDSIAATADNAAFVLNDANYIKRAGAVPVVMGTSLDAHVGMNDYNLIKIKPVANKLYFKLRIDSDATPLVSGSFIYVQVDVNYNK